MIVDYYRPKTIEAALKLLSRADPITVPLGGGTVLNQPSDDQIAVVDLQALGLNSIDRKENTFKIGSTVTLQQLVNVEGLYPELKKAVQHEATYNTRQAATIAGALVSSRGRSPLATSMLALGSLIFLLPGNEKVPLGDFLPLRSHFIGGKLISQVLFSSQLNLSYDYVARTPADLPIVCVGVAQWPSGRTRVALGGYGDAPILAFDGPDSNGAEEAARDAFKEAEDKWGGAEYRSDVAGILTKRCLNKLETG
jgi:putative selenate reductase FAD-binding subunit